MSIGGERGKCKCCKRNEETQEPEDSVGVRMCNARKTLVTNPARPNSEPLLPHVPLLFNYECNSFLAYAVFLSVTSEGK